MTIGVVFLIMGAVLLSIGVVVVGVVPSDYQLRASDVLLLWLMLRAPERQPAAGWPSDTLARRLFISARMSRTLDLGRFGRMGWIRVAPPPDEPAPPNHVPDPN